MHDSGVITSGMPLNMETLNMESTDMNMKGAHLSLYSFLMKPSKAFQKRTSSPPLYQLMG